jgi:hypothetical protein
MLGLFSDKLSHDDSSLLGCYAMSAAKYCLHFHTQAVKKDYRSLEMKALQLLETFVTI